MLLACVNCKAEGEHWVDWSLDTPKGVATVRTKCPSCGATGSTTTDQQTYDAAFKKQPSVEQIALVLAAIKRTLIGAKVEP